MERLACGTPVERGLLVVAALSAALWAYACGDGTTEPPTQPPDPPRPTTVTVSPATAQLAALGATVQLSAEVRDQNGQTMAGAAVSWSSADTTVAAVDSAGLVTAIGGRRGNDRRHGRRGLRCGAGDGHAVGRFGRRVTRRGHGRARRHAPAGGGGVRRKPGTGSKALSSHGRRAMASVARVDAAGLVTGVTEGTATITAAAGNASGTSEIAVENPDRTALVALYNATDGPNWINNDNWLTDAPLGQWYGVDTDASGRVVRLDLSGTWAGRIHHGLSGPIPSELGNLSNLTYLSLWLNDLTGPIPPELGNLASLESLYLGYNNLTGPIPPELGDLTSLSWLNLRSNDLSGPIPPELANLSNPGMAILLPGGVCVPDDLLAWAVELRLSVFRCSSGGRLLPSALIREDGNGVSLALPNDLREPSALTISHPSVVAASVSGGWLELVPLGRGSAEVEVVPSGGGAPASARVVVRAAVGTFGIDIVMERPAPVTYEKALTAGADWWSSVLDGTEWPDRRPTCLNDRATALADELLIHARIDPDTRAGYASTCFRSDGNQAALDPGGGAIAANPGNAQPLLVQHEIGHLLGLVLWRPESGLVTRGRRILLLRWSPGRWRRSGRAAEIPTCPGVPFDGVHWTVKDFMGVGSRDGTISVAALADGGLHRGHDEGKGPAVLARKRASGWRLRERRCAGGQARRGWPAAMNVPPRAGDGSMNRHRIFMCLFQRPRPQDDPEDSR